MKHRLRSLFALTCAMLLPCIAQTVECPSIQYEAASYEAGDRVAELGSNPKVAVGQDGDTRYFTGEHIDLRLSDAPVSATQIDIMADFHEDKETVFQFFAETEDQAKPILQLHQDYHHLWVVDGGKKKDRRNERYYHYKKPNSYRFVFKKDTIRAFLNQEYIGSVEGNNKLARIAITGLTDTDKIFSARILTACDDSAAKSDAQ